MDAKDERIDQLEKDNASLRGSVSALLVVCTINIPGHPTIARISERHGIRVSGSQPPMEGED